MIASFSIGLGRVCADMRTDYEKVNYGWSGLGMFSRVLRSSKYVATLSRFLADMVKIPGHGVRSTPKVGRACKVGGPILRCGSEKRD